jgi:hypothetical protein
MRRSIHAVHRDYADGVVLDRKLVRSIMGADLFAIGRDLVDEGARREARAAFLAAVGYRPTARALGWTLVLSLPARASERAGRRLVSLKRLISQPDVTGATRWSG